MVVKIVMECVKIVMERKLQSKLIKKKKECNLYNTSILVWWDNLKYKIKIYPKIISKQKNREYYRIQNSIQMLSQNIANGNIIDIAKYEQLIKMQRCYIKIQSTMG